MCNYYATTLLFNVLPSADNELADIYYVIIFPKHHQGKNIKFEELK